MTRLTATPHRLDLRFRISAVSPLEQVIYEENPLFSVIEDALDPRLRPGVCAGQHNARPLPGRACHALQQQLDNCAGRDQSARRHRHCRAARMNE